MTEKILITKKKKINDFEYVTLLQNGGDMTECETSIRKKDDSKLFLVQGGGRDDSLAQEGAPCSLVHAGQFESVLAFYSSLILFLTLCLKLKSSVRIVNFNLGYPNNQTGGPYPGRHMHRIRS
jgi:hypothetical protein